MKRIDAADVFLGSEFMRHDAIVIGSDEAAFAAALEGSKHGLDVLLIDDGSLCSDSLVRRRSLSMHHLREAVVRSADFHQVFDIRSRALRLRDVHLNTLAKKVQEVGEAQNRALRHRLSSNGVRVVHSGPARLLSGNRVLMGSCDVREAPIIVIASGSRPRRPGRFPFDGRVVCDPWSIVHFEHVPRNVLIVGAETIGCEFACLFASLGTTVTLLDRRGQMLRYVDRDVIEILHRRMQALGIDVVLNETLEALDIDESAGGPDAVVRLGNGRVEKCERVLIVAGERANVKALGLEEAGIAKDSLGFIITDGHYHTSQPGVFAVGGAISDTSVRAGPQQGRAAMRYALGVEDEMASDWPITIYSIQEIAMVGLTQEMCERLEIPHVVGLARYENLLCSQIRGDREGLIKLVASRQDRRLLGVHLIGSCARELVQIGASVLRQEGPVNVLADAVFSEPSLSEAYGSAARDCLDQLHTASTH